MRAACQEWQDIPLSDLTGIAASATRWPIALAGETTFRLEIEPPEKFRARVTLAGEHDGRAGWQCRGRGCHNVR